MVVLERYGHITFDHEDDILIRTMNRPQRLNEVNGQLHHELQRAFWEVDYDEDSKVVVRIGGNRPFCVGGDINGMEESGNPMKERSAAVLISGSTRRSPGKAESWGHWREARERHAGRQS